MQRCFEAHRAVLEAALTAAAPRTSWSAAPETPSGKLYGESAKADAEAAFKVQLGEPKGGLQRLSCHRRQSVRQRLPDGHGLYRQPFPGGGRSQAGYCLRTVWDA